MRACEAAPHGSTTRFSNGRISSCTEPCYYTSDNVPHVGYKVECVGYSANING